MEIPVFSDSHILVVGDLMLDRYYTGDTKRISPEAPVPVVRVEQMHGQAGGAGNVALNIRALDAKVSVLGFVGKDDTGDELIACMKDAGVNIHVERTDQARTITKLRVLSRHQQLIRLDFEDDFAALNNQSLLSGYQSLLTDVDIVVLSDYGKGTLSDCSEYIRLARQAGVSVLVDPKGTDFLRYQGATMLTPNRLEFEAVVGVCANQTTLEQKGQTLLGDLTLDAMLVTQGELGMTLFIKEHNPLHFSTQAREVYDVTGAGDTVISTLAAMHAAGLDFAHATALANVAAGIVVGKLGTATVSVNEIRNFIHPNNLSTGCMMTISEVCSVVDEAKSRGETIVLTNGCFDLLHPGHLRYLQQAKDLGDRLIILINDDASVRRLKGQQRPINSLSSRIEMLSAMACVDWVIAFSNDTPETEICEIMPDILVKGGDYQAVEQIAGHDCVVNNGGTVKVLQFANGFSSSEMITKIRSGK